MEPRNRHQYGEAPKEVSAGLQSTAPPTPQPPKKQRPVTMPKLIWPEQLRWKPNGAIDMKSLDMPFVLKKLLEWRHDHPDMIDIAGPPDPEEDNLDDEDALERRKAEAAKWDDENKVRPYRLRKWHVVEKKFPQPPHGIEGAAEHARILRKARRTLRKELAAVVAAGADGAAPPFAIGGDDCRLRSPSGSTSSMCGRLVPPELLLGTSPGAGYIASPRSFGRLSQAARPFQDKNPFVGQPPQPSLRPSPRGACPEVRRKKPWPEYERKTMGDEAFALFVPKWREYDNSVDQVNQQCCCTTV